MSGRNFIRREIDFATLCLTMMFVLTSHAEVAWAIVLSSRDQNHEVTPGQPMYGVNLDGVVALGNGEPGSMTFEDIIVFECSGALITDRHVLTAAHCLDQNRDGESDFTVSSFPYVAGFQWSEGELLIQVDTNSIHFPASWPEAAATIGDHDVGGEDLAVLELLEATPPDIPRYQLYGGRDELGATIVLTGYGTTGYGDTGIGEVAVAATVKRAGLNRLEAYFDEREIELGFDFDSGEPAHNALRFIGEESDLGFGAAEVLTAFGDSGGPLFIDEVIAGVSAFNVGRDETDFNDEFDQSWGEAGFATRVSSFRDFITRATNGDAVFVPEPGFGLSGFWCAFVLLARSRRDVLVTEHGFTGPMDDFEHPMETPADRAEAFCQQAIDTFGRRRIQLAKQAVAEDPTHVEAT